MHELLVYVGEFDKIYPCQAKPLKISLILLQVKLVPCQQLKAIDRDNMTCKWSKRHEDYQVIKC